MANTPWAHSKDMAPASDACRDSRVAAEMPIPKFTQAPIQADSESLTHRDFKLPLSVAAQAECTINFRVQLEVDSEFNLKTTPGPTCSS